MRYDTTLGALHKRRVEMALAAFEKPPQNFDEFKQRLGLWQGMGEAIKLIDDMRRKEEGNED